MFTWLGSPVDLSLKVVANESSNGVLASGKAIRSPSNEIFLYEGRTNQKKTVHI